MGSEMCIRDRSWTAKRIINEQNINLPEDPEKDELGIIMQMKV